jgi:hypothetical protein
MSAATMFLTYLWHYLIARTVYDQVLRPIIHGRASVALVLGLVLAAFVLGRATRRRA